MELKDQIVVVTGAASGIGRALCFAAHKAGARKVVASDFNLEGAQAVANAIGGVAIRCDVSKEAEIRALIQTTEAEIGPIGLFCSNAGIQKPDPDLTNAASAPDAAWTLSWGVHVMAAVYAARALVPLFIARGGGYFLNTVSAAGLLSDVSSGPYSTTKHAAIGFAEYLALAHHADGIKVSVLCPQGVATPMLDAMPDGPQNHDGVLTPDAVAAIALQGVAEERFLILPHPQVATYMAAKTTNYDRWLKGMAKLRRKFVMGWQAGPKAGP